MNYRWKCSKVINENYNSCNKVLKIFIGYIFRLYSLLFFIYVCNFLNIMFVGIKNY